MISHEQTIREHSTCRVCITGSCQQKSESAVMFTGKSCKVQKTVGFSKNTVQGGANEIVPIDLSKLTMTNDDSSSAAANATATAGK